MIEADIGKLNLFRQELFALFERRREASFELIDALCSQTHAKQVVELSMNPHYRRNYCSITRSLGEFYSNSSVLERDRCNQEVSALLAQACPMLLGRKFPAYPVVVQFRFCQEL